MNRTLKMTAIMNLLFYVEVIMVIILSGSAYISVKEAEAYRPYLNLLINIIAACFALLSIKKKKRLQQFVWIFIILSLFVLLGAVNFPPNAVGMIQDLLSFILFVFMIITLAEMGIDYECIIFRIIFLISIASMIVYFMVNVMEWNVPYIKLEGGYYYRIYLGVYAWTHAFAKPWNEFNRLSSIFWEPGIYAIYLNYALFYLLYRRPFSRKDLVKFAILIVNIMLTVSATGWVLCILLIASRFIRNNRYKKEISIIAVLAVSPAVVLILMRKMNTNAVSFSHRLNDLLLGMKLFSQNLLLGIGYESNIEFNILQNLERGNSNGLVSWFYQNGIVGIFYLLIPFICLFRALKTKMERYDLWIFIMAFVLCNMTEPLMTRPFNRMLIAIVLAMALGKDYLHERFKEQKHFDDCSTVLRL